METTRYAAGDGVRPGSLALSGALVALAVAGILSAAPDVVKGIIKDGPIEIYQLPIPPEPQPLPKPEPKRQASAKPDQSHPVQPEHPVVEVWTPPTGPNFAQGDPVRIDEPSGTSTGTGPGTAIDPAPPVVVAPTADPRYADDFQPLYPAEERRLGHEGVVKVRVLVGADGRVKAIEPVSAPNAAFFEATQRQALRKWRFRPGTRDGVPVDSWHVMRVKFLLTDE